MNNEFTFENANLAEEAVDNRKSGSLDVMFLAAFGSFLFAGLYFVGTLL